MNEMAISDLPSNQHIAASFNLQSFLGRDEGEGHKKVIGIAAIYSKIKGK
jgi:hypothetical protein